MYPTLTDQVRQKYAWTAREVIQKEFSQLTVLGACCGGSDDGASAAARRALRVGEFTEGLRKADSTTYGSI